MVYYLGCNFAPPLTPVWDERAPAFYVTSVLADELDRIRTKLSQLHIVYIGSHEGCGCGFRSERNGVPLLREGAEASAEAGNHAALVKYLQALPAQGHRMQLFGCWSGDEMADIEFRRECRIAELGTPNFAFREREIITLS